MKTIISLGAFVLAVFLFSQSAAADTPVGVFAVSPDHPSTWVAGADRVHQALRWDSDRKVLVVDVKYSTILYADSVHPTQEADYTLTFPTVRFNPAESKFTADGVTIATLHHGFFGPDVVLDKGAELDIHRHHGRIFARIQSSENDED